MGDELNKVDESKAINEVNDISEIKNINETQNIVEFVNSDIDNKTTQESKKKNKEKSSIELTRALSTTILALVGVVTVTGFNFSNIVRYENASIGDVVAYSNAITIDVNVKKWSDSLRVCFYNDNFDIYEDVEFREESEYTTTIQIDYDMSQYDTYYVSLLGEKIFMNSVIDEVKIKKENILEEELINIGVTYECTCNVDSNFHFKIDYDPNIKYYSNFVATLTDYLGTSYTLLIDDPHQEQTINVVENNLLGGPENYATFVITYDDNSSGEIVNKVLINDTEVLI